MDWDEGPDRGGPHAPYVQSERIGDYDRAFDRLRAAGCVYPCFCSRKDVASAASAPQEPGDEHRYPGTCRALAPDEAARRLAEGRRHAWRFRVEADAPAFPDRVRGPQPPQRPGDFVVRRSDGIAAYQLAVVVDDATMGITEVVRGDDLLPSTARQLLLYRALRWEPPAFAHVPLWLGPDGVRLSKRHPGTSLRELRGRGIVPERLVGWMAHRLGLVPAPDPVVPPALVPGFDLARAPLPHQIGLAAGEP